MKLSEEDVLEWRWKIGEVAGAGLFVGGDLPADEVGSIDALAAWVIAGVTDILDVREEWSDEEFVTSHVEWMGYTHLGTHDDGGEQAAEWFEAGVQAARAIDGRETGLLVHCHMGINRGPSMAFAILLHRGWNVIEALDAIAAARPIAAISYAEDAVRWYAADQSLTASRLNDMLEDVRPFGRRR